MVSIELNGIDYAGMVLIPIPWIVFYMVVTSHFKNITNFNALLTVFSIRAASLLPIYSLSVFIALLVPRSFPAMRVPQAVFEAYAVYCFFAMLTINCGGPKKVQLLLQGSRLPFIFCRFRQEDPVKTYSRMQNCLWQFLFIRPVLQFIGAIGAYADKEELYSAMVILAAISTFIMIPAMFTVARILYDECCGLSVAMKFVVIKISVGIILIEDAVQQFLYSSGAISISDDVGLNHLTEEEKFIRIYCLIAIVECALLSIVMYFGFTKPLRPSVNCILMPDADLPETDTDPRNTIFDADGNAVRTWTWSWYWANVTVTHHVLYYKEKQT